MAGKGIRFYLEGDDVAGNVKKVGPFVDKFVGATMRYYAPQVENYAKANARWKDQTSNARNGLLAQSGKQGGEHFIVLAHRVPYGIWLEVRWGGKYAIIEPTVTEFGPRVMSTLNKIIENLGKSSP